MHSSDQQGTHPADDQCGNYQPLLDGDLDARHTAGSDAAAYAFTIPAAQGPAARAACGAALPELPDAAQLWQQEGFLVKLWFSVSAVTLVSSLFWLELGFLAGLGVAGASLTVCACCRRREPDLAATLLTTRLLAVVNAALSGGTALALLYITALRPCASLAADGLAGDEEPPCSRVIITLLVVAVWHLLNAALAARVVLRVSHVCKALNPDTSGLVAVA